MFKLPVIETRNLTIRFSINKGLFKKVYFNAVDHVNLKIHKSEIVTLVGESGSGKTTLAKATLRLIKPSEGEILYKGKDIWKLKSNEYKEYRLNAQYVPQDPYASIHPFKKVRTILEDIIKYHHLVEKEKIENKIVETLERVGLTPPTRYLDKYPFELSGGERQRLAIAKAIVFNPEYIVADEPVTMLDASIKAGIINTLKNLVNEIGSSLLFITHELSLVGAFGKESRVEVMYLGKIVERGSVKQILLNPLHPYTQILLNAIPIPDPEKSREQKLLIKNVNPPNPIEKPPGCIFSTRCPYVNEKCKAKEPEMTTIEPGHYVACHLYLSK